MITTRTVPPAKAPIPRQIGYIIGNEGCERFSFYGMRNIVTVFLVTRRCCSICREGDRAGVAKDVFVGTHSLSEFTFLRYGPRNLVKPSALHSSLPTP